MSGPTVCCRCGRPVTRDEIAVTRKLINRGTDSFYCVPCLAAYFEVTPETIREKIAWFRAMGCTLFAAEAETDRCGSQVAEHAKETAE